MRKVREIKLNFGAEGIERLTRIYRERIGDYPKFFKMDPLCKLGFVASELLLQEERGQNTPDGKPLQDREDRAVILFNRSASLADDSEYQKTIRDPENYFPSPSVFVYTLPNIVTGEIAIRNKYYGKTSFYVLEECSEERMMEIVGQSFQDPGTKSALAGWVETDGKEVFETELFIIEK